MNTFVRKLMLIVVLLFGSASLAAPRIGHSAPRPGVLAYERLTGVSSRTVLLDTRHNLEITVPAENVHWVAPAGWLSRDELLILAGFSDTVQRYYLWRMHGEAVALTPQGIPTCLSVIPQQSIVLALGSHIYRWSGTALDPVGEIGGAHICPVAGQGHELIWQDEAGIQIVDRVGNRQQLTSDGQFTAADWSRDGRLALTILRGRATDLYLWDGAALTNLSQTPMLSELAPQWNAQGQLVWIERDEVATTLQLWDGDQRQTLPIAITQFPLMAWSDSGQLAVIDRERNLVIWQAGHLTHLTGGTLLDGEANTMLAWNSNDELVFSANRRTEADLWLWDGERLHQLTTSPGYERAPVWSP